MPGGNKEVGMKIGKWTLLKPSPEVCQKCAVDHLPEEPHNKDSLYYQMWFQNRYGRGATWADAIAHCNDELRAAWKAELILRGAWSEPKGGNDDV